MEVCSTPYNDSAPSFVASQCRLQPRHFQVKVDRGFSTGWCHEAIEIEISKKSDEEMQRQYNV
jgi:hypothetical protein